MKKLIVILLLISTARTGAEEKLNFLEPAPELWGIKKILVADLKYIDVDLTPMLTEEIKRTQYYSIVKFDKIDQITPDDLKDIVKVAQLCSLANADAMIFASVVKYQVEPDEMLTEKINKAIWTGEFEHDADGKIVEETINGQKVNKKKYNNRLIEQPYVIRKGTVSITFNIVDGIIGKLSYNSSIAKGYNSGKCEKEKVKDLPSSDKILTTLTREVLADFGMKISPKLELVDRSLEKGDGLMAEGNTLAMSSLWAKAIEKWQTALQQTLNNPGLYYNLGIAYEAQGEYQNAESYYRKALLLTDKKNFSKALENIRKARERKIALLSKGKK
jgi:tetratricopeptide (TPR) repeat protein